MLSKIEIAETKDTPFVLLDAEKKVFEISGNSMLENSYGFYAPIHDWFSMYFKSNPESVELNFKIKYFNSSTTKELFVLFSIIAAAKVDNCKINWFVEEDDELTEELGYEVKEVLELPIEVIYE